MGTMHSHPLYAVICSSHKSFCIYPPFFPPSSPASVIPHGPIIISKTNRELLHSTVPEIMWILNHTPHEQSTRGCLVHHERCRRKRNICNTDRPPFNSKQWCQHGLKCSPVSTAPFHKHISVQKSTVFDQFFSPLPVTRLV